jgi:hypothetical protein
VLLMLPRFGGANHANDHNDPSDIAKSVFQVHAIDAEGNVLIRRKLKRRYVLGFFEKLQPCAHSRVRHRSPGRSARAWRRGAHFRAPPRAHTDYETFTRRAEALPDFVLFLAMSR